MSAVVRTYLLVAHLCCRACGARCWAHSPRASPVFTGGYQLTHVTGGQADDAAGGEARDAIRTGKREGGRGQADDAAGGEAGGAIWVE